MENTPARTMANMLRYFSWMNLPVYKGSKIAEDHVRGVKNDINLNIMHTPKESVKNELKVNM